MRYFLTTIFLFNLVFFLGCKTTTFKEPQASVQKGKPQSIVVPVSGVGDVTATRKLILQNTLTDELKEHFRIISQDRFEEAQEKAFEELEYEECTEDRCIMIIQEMLQVENVFHLQVIGDGNDSQLSLNWKTLDEKKNETDVCIGCNTFDLNEKVAGLVEKLVGKSRGILFRVTPYTRWVDGGKRWLKSGDERIHLKYEGDIKNNVPEGHGILTLDGFKQVGEWKNGQHIGSVRIIFPEVDKYEVRPLRWLGGHWQTQQLGHGYNLINWQDLGSE